MWKMHVLYKSILFAVMQEVSSICHSLNVTKHSFDYCLNLTKPLVTSEQQGVTLGLPEEKSTVKRGFIHKIFHILFGELNI